MSVQSEESSHVNLEAIFKEIVEKNSNIKISLDTLSNLILNDLALKLDDLSEQHLTALPYMLISYIKKWPGWDKRCDYENGSLDLKSWYFRFRQYVMYKMTFLITKTLTSVDSELEVEMKKVKTVDNSTQLSNRATFANFNIDVSGPATLLSNLVFWGFNENITVEEHIERPWVALNIVQLINYPHIEVEFNSPELSFKRSFEPRISRYISGCADLLYEKPSFILGKHKINSTTPKFVFPTALLKEYITIYKDTMNSLIVPHQREEVDVILDQFYKDIVDISRNNVVPDNRQVSYNIGKNIFKRSKKISNELQEQPSGTHVVFNEVFLPRMITSFRYFTGMQEYSLEGQRMVSTKRNGNKMMMNFKPMITYKCTYCKLVYVGIQGRAKMLVHLENTHKREQPLLCLLCKKSFEITELATQRWKCVCQK